MSTSVPVSRPGCGHFGEDRGRGRTRGARSPAGLQRGKRGSGNRSPRAHPWRPGPAQLRPRGYDWPGCTPIRARRGGGGETPPALRREPASGCPPRSGAGAGSPSPSGGAAGTCDFSPRAPPRFPRPGPRSPRPGLWPCPRLSPSGLSPRPRPRNTRTERSRGSTAPWATRARLLDRPPRRPRPRRRRGRAVSWQGAREGRAERGGGGLGAGAAGPVGARCPLPGSPPSGQPRRPLPSPAAAGGAGGVSSGAGGFPWPRRGSGT